MRLITLPVAPFHTPLRGASVPPDPRPGNARLSYRVGGAGPARLFVGFSDDRRLVVLIVLIGFIVLVVLLVVPLVVFVVFVIIVVGVSRRHRVGHDGDEAPFDQPGGNVLGGAWGHVGSCWRDIHGRI